MEEKEKMQELLKESESIIDEVCEKYEYETEDTPKNKSLRTILRQIVPAMLVDSNEEDRKLFYQMLRKTPIAITENLTEKELQELQEKYIGNINPHIKEEKIELGEYGKVLAAGAYITEAKISKDMKSVDDKKSYIYIQRLNPYNTKAIDFLGTDINVPHLIHELGHAWNSEKEPYKILEDGTLIGRVGTAQSKYSFEKQENGETKLKLMSITGLFIEEGMNTVAEEEAMARYIGISIEEMQEAYRKILVQSEYQGFMSGMVNDLLDRTYKDDLKHWRLHGDENKLKKVESLMEQTDYWKNREKRALGDENDEISFAHKRRCIERTKKETIQEFFKKYEHIYFPDIDNMTPIQRIDNVLEQCYTFKGIKYKFDLLDPEQKACYQDITLQTLREGYILINQAKDRKIEEIKKVVGEMTASRVSNIIKETKKGFKEKENPKENQQGDNLNDRI